MKVPECKIIKMKIKNVKKWFVRHITGIEFKRAGRAVFGLKRGQKWCF